MSQENVEVVRNAVAAYDGGPDGFLDFFDPRVVHRAIEGAPDDVGEMNGIEALRRYYLDWHEMFDGLIMRLEDIRDAGGDRVVAQQHVTGKAKLSGLVTEIRYGVVYTLRDGLIVESREYADWEKALAAAGL